MGRSASDSLPASKGKHERRGRRVGISGAGTAVPAWRWGIITGLAVLGLTDIVVLNLVVLPQCLEEPARSAGAAVHREVELSGNAGAAAHQRGKYTNGAGATARQVKEYPGDTSGTAHRVKELSKVSALATSRSASGPDDPPNMEDILFGSNSSALSKRAMNTLNRVADIMRNQQGQRLLLRGHADDIGPGLHNLKLSERRATAAARFLASQGIAIDRIDTEGIGEMLPCDLRGTAVARARNRRVSIIWR